LPELRVMSAREVCRLLESHGFVRTRQKGSHVVMQQHSRKGTRTAIVPNHPEIALGTLKSIIRQSGLPQKLFER
jgi:predicted RNA binding protein YcfA (HicA-like mRNA interferase family)